MTDRVDQFESAFKRAMKTPYEHQPLQVSSVLLLSDLEGEDATRFESRVRSYLRALGKGPEDEPTKWTHLAAEDFGDVDELLQLVKKQEPSLICTYRSLRSQAWRWSYTLGRYVDILAQETQVPVLLLPNPRAESEAPESFVHGAPRYGESGTRTVMAMTDHLTGDHRLVDWAVRFTLPGGRLFLTHVEDGYTLDRYMDAISKIPQIETEEARELLQAQLLKEPRDYADSVSTILDKLPDMPRVTGETRIGHHLSEYARLINEHEVDLLVLNTKDHEQLAMHGLAYPLVIELRHVPTLML
ncbi:MAG: hypothetical protein GY946_11745 [bacterium]|nr:hypothetical protein [bacterium]